VVLEGTTYFNLSKQNKVIMKAYPNRTFYEQFDKEDPLVKKFEPEEVKLMIFEVGDKKSGVTELKIRDLGNGVIELSCLDEMTALANKNSKSKFNAKDSK